VTAKPRAGGITAVDPRVGQRLRIDGAEWEVTDHSSYWNPEGYRVTEWCCETEDTEAYLLKEVKEGAPTRWFFTRKIDGTAVALPAKQPLPAWIEQNPTGAPPPELTYQGRAYRHTEIDEGTYEDEPGQRVSKTTWEYWDAADGRNLAVERWEDGRVDVYHGAYIEPGAAVPVEDEPGAGETAGETAGAAAGPPGLAATLGLRPGSRAASPGQVVAAVAKASNPFRAALVIVPFAYLLPFFLGRPFDEGLAAALGVAGVCGWLLALFRAPAAAGVAALGVPILAVLFWYYPPLTSLSGLGLLLAAPALVAFAGRGAVAHGRKPVVYAAAAVVAGPLLGLGFYHYFAFAPVPHSLAQIGLALGPALVSVVAGTAIATLVLSSAEERAAPAPGARAGR
jgi:hypothetical protein